MIYPVQNVYLLNISDHILISFDAVWTLQHNIAEFIYGIHVILKIIIKAEFDILINVWDMF